MTITESEATNQEGFNIEFLNPTKGWITVLGPYTDRRDAELVMGDRPADGEYRVYPNLI